MKCPYCNAEIEDGAKFCTNCGKSLVSKADEQSDLGDEPPVKSYQKAVRILVIAAAVIMTVIIGITLGIRSYMQREYQRGVAAYENQEYESAAEAFRHALRWGPNQDAYALLAHSYYRLGRFEDAFSAYETAYENFSDSEDVIRGYADTCEKLAYESIGQNDSEKAVFYLSREYELTEDERISRRIRAIEGGGSYADEYGNVYNLAGMLETAVCYDEKGNELYRADLVYDADGRWQFAKAYAPTQLKKSVFGTFEWLNEGEYELSVYPQSDGYSWIAEKTERNSDSYVKRITALTEASRYILNFTYSHNSRGILEKETITSSDGQKMEIEWTAEEQPDHAILNIADEKYIAVITYNAKGQTESVTVTRNLLQTVYSIVNQYNEDGSVSETVIRNSGMPLTIWKPYGAYSRTVTQYSAQQPISRTVYSENGKLIARGYYVEGSGWLMMYTGA